MGIWHLVTILQIYFDNVYICSYFDNRSKENPDKHPKQSQIALVLPKMSKGDLESICYGKSIDISFEIKIRYCYQAAKGIAPEAFCEMYSWNISLNLVLNRVDASTSEEHSSS